MTNEIVKLEAPELQGLEKSKAEQIKATFEPMAKMLSEFEDAYNVVVSEAEKEITFDVTAKAKRLRIDIGKVRIETEKARKEQKEEYLRAGKAIDGVSNILKWAVTDKENKLKEIENYFEIQEQKRLEALQLERAEKLAPYVEDAHERDLAKFADDEFEALLAMKKKEHEDKIAAEKKAEEERIAKEKAEAEERKRIAAENEKLKKEAEERERLAKIEAEKREKAEQERKAKEEAERKIREEKERKERAEYEAKIKAEREAKEKALKLEREKAEAERKAIEEKARKEREEVERIAAIERKKQAEIQAKKDAELKAIQEAKEKLEREKQAEIDRLKAIELQKQKDAEKLAKSSDKNKLNVWVDSFVISQECNVVSDKSIETKNEIIEKFNSFKNWAKKQVENI